MFLVQRLHLTSEDWHKVHYSYVYIYDKLVLCILFEASQLQSLLRVTGWK